MNSAGMRIIALEEHYVDLEVKAMLPAGDRVGAKSLADRIDDIGALRLREMDDAGIDMQVLSHSQPATQNLPVAQSIVAATAANDRLAALVKAHPTRFAAFATLPIGDALASAIELERSVKMGFKGAMLHGLAPDLTFFDNPRFWPVFARAEALDVPVYIHPARPHPAVIDAYLKDYASRYPSLLNAGWGFTIETATTAIRLILSGLFDAHPRLKIILGHLGEGLPFSLHRISENLSRDHGKSPDWFRETFCRHFWLTTSGNFSTSALLCSMLEVGMDKIMFAVDWPFVMNQPGVSWVDGLTVSNADKHKLFHGNAEQLLRL
jgi:predicted TIM-barrel fold metal-dependent hydrolase